MIGRILSSEALYDFESYTDRLAITVLPELWKDRNALYSELETHDILLVRNQTIVDDELLDHTPRLKAVGRVGVGLDNIDIDAVRKRGAEVFYAPGASTVAVAEYCLAQILNLTRNLPTAHESTKRGEWNRPPLIGKELSELTVGIVGFGRIGQALAERLHALGVPIVVCSRTASSVPPHFTSVSFEDLLTRSDVVSIHLPGTEETKNLFSAVEFQKMKHGSYLINSSRGTAICEADLIEALSSGPLAGAALDVRAVEPPTAAILETLPNVLLSPHIACLTNKAQNDLTISILDDALLILKGEAPNNPAPA